MIPATSEEDWRHFLRDTPEWHPLDKRTVVISPHPDDETLGAGGLIAAQRRLGISVRLIAITDGEAAYANDGNLAKIRLAELEAAVGELGVDSGQIVHLHFPDSAVTQHEEQLTSLLRMLVEPGDLVVAPWDLDPHPDHEVCGRASRAAAERNGAALISYFFWSWHRNSVESLAALPLRQFNLDEDCQARKAKALAHYKSQLEHEFGPPILPELLLAPARRSFETFIS